LHSDEQPTVETDDQEILKRTARMDGRYIAPIHIAMVMRNALIETSETTS
jgi:hypothetical protein